MPRGESSETLVDSIVNTRPDYAEIFKKYGFYHIIEVAPGVFTPGDESNREDQKVVLDALRKIDISGKRFLDVGCRDGLFSFEAERRGAAEVIGIDNDLSLAATEFLIPHFASKVKMIGMNLYDLSPEAFGLFDVVLFAGVLYHLRYPIWGLKQILSVMKDGATLVLETAVLDALESHALMYCPTGAESPYEATSITFFNVKGLTDTLYSLGVTVQKVLFLGPRAAPERAATQAAMLPVNRATFVCQVTRDVVSPRIAKYWDLTHSFHTKRTLPEGVKPVLPAREMRDEGRGLVTAEVSRDVIGSVRNLGRRFKRYARSADPLRAWAFFGHVGLPFGSRKGRLKVPPGVRHLLEARPAGAHAPTGTHATQIVGFVVTGPDGDEQWSVESGGVLRFWYLVEAREPCHDLNVGIHFYDGRGILAFAVGTANRGVVFPALAPGDRVVCALTIRLALQSGEYTLVPQAGGLTDGSPEPGLLHDRLVSLPLVVITRAAAGPSPFYGLVDLQSDLGWARLE
jgi:2-polyprenyl-3-methyl-5-hydroxy-6-metoxy-1,4-benzoquinol methylase